MAILGQLTLNNISIYQVDADPSTTAGGFDAPLGSLAVFDQTGIYQKTSATNLSDWERTSRNQIRKYVTQTAHGFTIGKVVYWTGTAYALASAATVAQTIAVFVVCEVPTANTFVIAVAGYVTGMSGLTANALHYLSDVTAGSVTTTPPTTNIILPILYADTTTSGFVRISYSDPLSFTEVSSSTVATTTSTTDVVLTGMTITPIAGTYLVVFSASGSNSGVGSNTLTMYVNAVAQADTARTSLFNNSIGNTNASVASYGMNKVVSVAGGQAIDIRWKVNASTGSINGRTLSIVRIGG